MNFENFLLYMASVTIIVRCIYDMIRPNTRAPQNIDLYFFQQPDGRWRQATDDEIDEINNIKNEKMNNQKKNSEIIEK